MGTVRWRTDESEDSHRGCVGDVLRQTVPNTSSGDQKIPVTDSEQSSMADDVTKEDKTVSYNT